MFVKKVFVGLKSKKCVADRQEDFLFKVLHNITSKEATERNLYFVNKKLC
jgi:hypothetical protein